MASSPSPPGAFRLLHQIRGHIRRLGSEGAGAHDADGELVALALAGRAAAQRLASADHVLLVPGRDGAGQPPGALVVQGRLDDPAQRRVWMALDEAGAVPPRESLRALQARRRVSSPRRSADAAHRAPPRERPGTSAAPA